MIKLYGVLRSRATRNYWLLKELGVPFEHVPVIQAYRLADPLAADAPLNTRSPSYLAINPNGQIPSLADDGYTLHESLAINLYLARKFGGPLAPATLEENGHMMQWSLWAAATVEPHSILIVYHRVSKPAAERVSAVADAAVDALRGPIGVLDSALARSGYLVGDRFTAADINVAEVVRYALPAPELFAQSPRVKAWLAACHERPAFRDMMATRELEPA